MASDSMRQSAVLRHAITPTKEQQVIDALKGCVRRVHTTKYADDAFSSDRTTNLDVLVRTHASRQFLETVADRYDMTVQLIENDDVSREMAEELGDLFRLTRA